MHPTSIYCSNLNTEYDGKFVYIPMKVFLKAFKSEYYFQSKWFGSWMAFWFYALITEYSIVSRNGT